MITGTINADYEAVIRLRVHGPTGHAHEVEAIIDTGFNGFLTLPPALVTALGLTRRSRGRALLANGSEELFDIYGVTVLWDGQHGMSRQMRWTPRHWWACRCWRATISTSRSQREGRWSSRLQDKAVRADRSACLHRHQSGGALRPSAPP